VFYVDCYLWLKGDFDFFIYFLNLKFDFIYQNSIFCKNKLLAEMVFNDEYKVDDIN